MAIVQDDIMKRTEGGAEEELNIDPETKKPYPVPKIPLVSIEEAEEFRIDVAIASIYQDYPFLGYVFSSLKRKRAWYLPTAGISADNILYYNPRFMASLSSDSQKFVLLHEILHKINYHFIRGDEIMKMRYNMTTREFIEWQNKIQKETQEDSMSLDAAKKYLKKKDKISRLLRFMNVCEDIAINQTCEGKFGRLPIGVFLDDVNKEYSLKMKPQMHWEYYFEEMEKGVKNLSHTVDHDIQIIGGDGEGGLNVELTENEKKQFDQVFKNVCKKGATIQKQHESRQKGNGANYKLSDILPDFNIEIQDKHIWENIINSNFGTHRVTAQESTLKRPNRRDDENPWGRRRKTMNRHTVIILDTSGSCGSVIDKFLGVINRAMKKYKTTIDLLCTTTYVYNVYEKLKTIDMNVIDIQNGGTDLTTAQNWIIQNKPNEGKGVNVIVLTDGETDWLTNTKFTTSAIYTERYSPLKGVTNYATIYEED